MTPETVTSPLRLFSWLEWGTRLCSPLPQRPMPRELDTQSLGSHCSFQTGRQKPDSVGVPGLQVQGARFPLKASVTFLFASVSSVANGVTSDSAGVGEDPKIGMST